MSEVDVAGTAAAATTSPNTVQNLVVTLRKMMLSGELPPGHRLRLRNLAEDLGVSFIPIREALRTLESQGLVVTRPGRSATVADLSREDLRSIYRLRLRLEPEIAYRSCELLSDQDFVELESLLNNLGDDSLGVDDVYDSHHAFHLELLRPAATEWDLRVLESLWHAGERYVRLAFSRLDESPGEHRRRYESHKELLDTFRSRDSDRSALALRQHLERNERLATDAIGF